MDDEREFSEILKEVIDEDERFHCKICNSGKEALVALEKEHFDCVFLDLIMPNIGGLQVLKTMKAKEIDTKVVVLSGFLDDNLIQDCKKFGASHVLSKPAEIHIIRSILKRVAAF